ncbi:MAG: hypothetical protein AAB443_02745 [Patescibacteria group bacterium]
MNRLLWLVIGSLLLAACGAEPEPVVVRIETPSPTVSTTGISTEILVSNSNQDPAVYDWVKSTGGANGEMTLIELGESSWMLEEVVCIQNNAPVLPVTYFAQARLRNPENPTQLVDSAVTAITIESWNSDGVTMSFLYPGYKIPEGMSPYTFEEVMQGAGGAVDVSFLFEVFHENESGGLDTLGIERTVVFQVEIGNASVCITPKTP